MWYFIPVFKQSLNNISYNPKIHTWIPHKSHRKRHTFKHNSDRECHNLFNKCVVIKTLADSVKLHFPEIGMETWC